MKNIPVSKRPLHTTGIDPALKEKSPGELVGMMWQLALNAWAFKENLNAEPRLQRDVVIKRRRVVEETSFENKLVAGRDKDQGDINWLRKN